MSNPVIERSSRTESDLFEIAVFIGEDNPDAALRFLDAAETAFKQLATLPEMGRTRKFKNLRLNNLRSWKVRGFDNYLVFYIPIPPGIQVIRVLHGAQDLDRIMTSS